MPQGYLTTGYSELAASHHCFSTACPHLCTQPLNSTAYSLPILLVSSVFSQDPSLHSFLLLKRWVTRAGCPVPWVFPLTFRHTCTQSDSKVQMLQLVSLLLQVSFQVTWGVMGCVHPVIEPMVVKPIPKYRGALSTCHCAWGLPPRSLLPILWLQHLLSGWGHLSKEGSHSEIFFLQDWLPLFLSLKSNECFQLIPLNR